MSDSSKTRWTKRRLLTWLKTQPNRYEFDGLQPIPITSANVDHDRVTQGLYRALEFRLRGTNYEALRPGPGIETINGAIRYPDPLVTFSRYGDCYHNVLPYLINVFEVVTPTSRHNDLSIKVREYASILSRRYVVLESSSIKLTMLAGDIPGCPWITTLLTSDDIVRLPQIGIEIPVAEIYGGITFGNQYETAN
jgi:Uma2 family endonuclease